MEKPTLIQAPAYLKDKGVLADGTRRLIVDLQEVNDDDLLAIIKHAKGQTLGWFVFSPVSIKENEIPTEPPMEFKTDKTPSQRLRAVIFKFWELKTSKKIDFELFYKKEMSRIIERIKQELD